MISGEPKKATKGNVIQPEATNILTVGEVISELSFIYKKNNQLSYLTTKILSIMKNLFFPLLFLVTIIALSGCNKDEEIKKIPDVSIFDVGDYTEWDYWIVGKDGDNLFVNASNNRPTSVFYTPDPEQDGYSVFFDEDGFPHKLVINDHIFIFANFSGTKIDAALISPDGTIKIARDVETGINWDEGYLKSSSTELSDLFRWTGHALGAAACITGILAGPATFGVSWVVTGIGCGAKAVSIIAEFMPEDFEVIGLTASTVGLIATTVGCVRDLGISCALGLASTAASLISLNEEVIEEAYDDVQVAVAALEYGYGDVQITLTWDNIADLDLHVIDPNGEHIYWDDPYSASNGVLDVDDIDGYGPENIYWPEHEAPSGNYSVFVHMFPWGYSYYPSNSNYTVLVNAFGETKKFTGSISYDEFIHITDFDQDGLKSENLKSTSTITTKKDKK